MFEHTLGGNYQDQGNGVTYTFPHNATCNISRVKIPIGGLTVQAWGHHFDFVTIQHFANVTAKISPKDHRTQNTPLYFPDHNVFNKPSKDYCEQFLKRNLSTQDYQTLLSQPGDEPMYSCINQWQQTALRELKAQLDEIISSNPHFPKKVSILYDNRRYHLTSHCELEFINSAQCIMHIDNTASFLPALMGLDTKFIEKELNHSIDDLLERLPDENSRFVDIHCRKYGNKLVSAEFSEPINKTFKETLYSRMIAAINLCGFEIKAVNLNHLLLQGLSNEGVNFTLHNKIQFALGLKSSPTAESIRDMGIRLRAEQAVLSYLLLGQRNIPHCSAVQVIEHGFNYTEEHWYANFATVCSELDNTIANLAYSDLSKLYLATELAGETCLADSFRPALLEALKNKVTPLEYLSIPSGDHGQLIEQIFAPMALYNPTNRTLHVEQNSLDVETLTNSLQTLSLYPKSNH